MLFAIVFSIIGYAYDEKEKSGFLIEVLSLVIVFILTHLITYLSYKKKKNLIN